MLGDNRWVSPLVSLMKYFCILTNSFVLVHFKLSLFFLKWITAKVDITHTYLVSRNIDVDLMNILDDLIRVFGWSPVETIMYFWINLLNLVKRFWLELQTNCENWTDCYFGIDGNGTFVLMYQILCDDKAQTNSIGISSWRFLDKTKEFKKSINISFIHSHPSVFYLYL